MAEPLFTDSKGREVAIPDLGGSVADTHAHLDMLEDPGLAIANAARAGVGFIATVADPSEDAERTFRELPIWFTRARELLDALDLAGTALPRARVILGVHPHNAKDLTPEDVQREAFRRQLAIARELSLPVVVHLRDAHADGETILAEQGLPQAGCILHCYNLGPELLGRFLRLGCSVSFAGPVTFKKADDVREAAALVPPERILSETDCPFMTPEPFRGRKNEPAFVTFTAARIAQARAEEPGAFGPVAYANALRLLDAERS